MKRVLHYQTCGEASTKTGYENLTSRHLVMVVGSASLLIPHQNTQVLPVVFTIKCEVVYEISRGSPMSFKHVSIWCLFFDPHLTTHQSNILGV